jgi:hypothetical protein
VFQIVFNTAQRFDVFFADQTESVSIDSRAARTANAMNVGFTVLRQLVIHNQIHAFNIQTTSGNIRCHHDVHIVFGFELLDHAISLSLSQQTRDRHRGQIIVRQEFCDAINIVFEVGENNRLLRLAGFHQRQKLHRLFAFAHMKKLILHVFGAGLITADIDFNGLGTKLISRVQNVEVQSRAENQELTLARNSLQNVFHIVFETHVEHAIGFIENDRADLFQIDKVFFEKIDQPARSRHDELNVIAKSFFLPVVTRSTIDRKTTQARSLAVFRDVLVNLLGQFASRNQDQNKILWFPIREGTLRIRRQLLWR